MIATAYAHDGEDHTHETVPQESILSITADSFSALVFDKPCIIAFLMLLILLASFSLASRQAMQALGATFAWRLRRSWPAILAMALITGFAGNLVVGHECLIVPGFIVTLLFMPIILWRLLR